MRKPLRFGFDRKWLGVVLALPLFLIQEPSLYAGAAKLKLKNGAGQTIPCDADRSSLAITEFYASGELRGCWVDAAVELPRPESKEPWRCKGKISFYPDGELFSCTLQAKSSSEYEEIKIDSKSNIKCKSNQHIALYKNGMLKECTSYEDVILPHFSGRIKAIQAGEVITLARNGLFFDRYVPGPISATTTQGEIINCAAGVYLSDETSLSSCILEQAFTFTYPNQHKVSCQEGSAQFDEITGMLLRCKPANRLHAVGAKERVLVECDKKKQVSFYSNGALESCSLASDVKLKDRTGKQQAISSGSTIRVTPEGYLFYTDQLKSSSP